MNERQVESIIDNQLKNLGWDENLISRQAPKTEKQKKLLGKLRPDYVLYSKNSDQPLIVIEAKKPHENLTKAITQGIDYAKKLEAPVVFATDGIFTKTYHIKANKPLYLNKEEVDELLNYSIALNYRDTNEYNTLDKNIIKSREELITIFSRLNNNFRDAGVRTGMPRIELFCNMLFLKIIDELADQENSLIKLPDWCRWNRIREKKGEELLTFLNGQAFNHFKNAYDGEVLSPIQGLLKYDILNNVVNELDNLNLSSTDTDIKGDAFEYFLRNYGGAETDFGEYFTPRHIVKALVKILNPQFGETVYDPFCGTGGMLINSFKHIHKRMPINEKTIDILKKHTIYGGELTEMFRVAKMNMILTGDGHSNINRQDSYEQKQTGKHDVVITNIPFGKKMKTEHAINYGYNTTSAEVTGVLHCLDALNDTSNARAGILVPEGILFDGSKAYTALRNQIVEKHSLESIISLPSGVFGKNTGVKSNILIIKKRANKNKDYIWFFDVKNDGFTLDAKRQKIDGQNDIDTVLSEKELTVEDKERLKKLGFEIIYKDKIRDNKYILKPQQYRKYTYNSKWKLVKLGDLVEFLPKSKRAASEGKEKGKYPFFTSSFNIKYIDVADYNDECIIIGDGGNSSIHISSEFSASDHNFIFKTKDTKLVLNSYIYYILLNSMDLIRNGLQGSALKNITKSHIQQIQIPLPSIEEQEKIVKQLEEIDNSIEHAENLVKSLKSNYFSLYGHTEISMMKLSEISTLIKGATPKYGNSNTIVIKSGQARGFDGIKFDTIYRLEQDKTDNKLLKKGDILINTTGVGTAGRITYFGLEGTYVTDSHITVIRVNKNINSRYVYFALSSIYSRKDLEKLCTGSTGQIELNKNTILNLSLPIPSLEKQEEIVKQCDEEINYIKMTEKMIEKQKEKMKIKLNEIWTQNEDIIKN